MTKKRWLVPAVALLLIAAAAVGAGCSGGGINEPLEGPLRENRGKWTALRATDYVYTLRIGCF